VDFAMVSAAKRNRKLVADLAAQRHALCEPQMMGIRWLSAANQTGMLEDKFDMIPAS